MFQRMWLLVVGLFMIAGASFLLIKFVDIDNIMNDFLVSVLFSMFIGLFIAYITLCNQSVESFFSLLKPFVTKNKIEQNNAKPQTYRSR